jgi:hypothetical protein
VIEEIGDNYGDCYGDHGNDIGDFDEDQVECEGRRYFYEDFYNPSVFILEFPFAKRKPNRYRSSSISHAIAHRRFRIRPCIAFFHSSFTTEDMPGEFPDLSLVEYHSAEKVFMHAKTIRDIRNEKERVKMAKAKAALALKEAAMKAKAAKSEKRMGKKKQTSSSKKSSLKIISIGTACLIGTIAYNNTTENSQISINLFVNVI